MHPRAAIYLDANAGAPLSEAASRAVFSFLSERETGLLLPNPSSPHGPGRAARAAIRRAREQVAAALGPQVRPEELFFTSSGTEACQMAIRSVLETALLQGEKPHWILGAGDHEAHLKMVEWLEARGGSASRIPLRADGSLDLASLSHHQGVQGALWRPQTRLVSASWVNNETGVIADVAELGRLCRSRGVPLHLDGAQAWGRLPIELDAGPADWASFSGHKIGALSGTGVVWRRRGRGAGPGPVLPGAQEGGWRGGTENLLGIVSLGAAAQGLDPRGWSERLAIERGWLEDQVMSQVSGARLHGAGAQRVANTSNFGFEGVNQAGLVAALDLAGYCVSSGAACSSGASEPSHVLTAMGLDPRQAASAVRVSLSPGNTRSELQGFVTALEKAVAAARSGSMSPVK